MTSAIAIAVDAGTSMLKAVAFDLQGRQLAVVDERNRYREPGGGVVEQDMDRTWALTAGLLRRLSEDLPDLRSRVAVLAVTGQGDGTWLIDRAGSAVAPAWLWLDSRAAGLVAEAEASGARAEIFRHTGSGLNACNQSAQLALIKRESPEILAAAATAFHCKDWIYFRLTGERVTDPSEGCFTFGDYRGRRYRDEVLEALDIADLKRLLPPMIDGAEVTHPLTSDAAAACGLPEGLPVCLGFIDVICAGLGAGLSDPEHPSGCSIVGSTSMHMRCFGRAAEIDLPPEPSGYTMPLPASESCARMQSNMAGTLNIDWLVKIACQAAGHLGHDSAPEDALQRLDSRVLEGQAGALLYHPYIHEAGERGPFVDTSARAQFLGLSTRAGFLDLLRAIYEGLGFAALDCYAAIGSLPAEIRMVGGAARSTALKTIFAAVLQVPVRKVAREEAGAAGAAMMAAVAIGAERNLDRAIETWIRPYLGAQIPPDPDLAVLYEKLFPIYLAARRTMPPFWQDLARLRQKEVKTS